MVLYGSQCWTTRKSDESRLRIFQRKILRTFKPYRDPQMDDWCITHDELCDLYNRPDLVDEI